MLPWLLSAALAQQAVDPFEEADESVLFRFEEELVTVASRYAQTVRKAPSRSCGPKVTMFTTPAKAFVP